MRVRYIALGDEIHFGFNSSALPSLRASLVSFLGLLFRLCDISYGRRICWGVDVMHDVKYPGHSHRGGDLKALLCLGGAGRDCE